MGDSLWWAMRLAVQATCEDALRKVALEAAKRGRTVVVASARALPDDDVLELEQAGVLVLSSSRPEASARIQEGEEPATAPHQAPREEPSPEELRALVGSEPARATIIKGRIPCAECKTYVPPPGRELCRMCAPED